MRSHKQKTTSILNGRKSSGPVSEEGKSRSSQNAVKHGLSSRIVVLACEDPAAYENLVNAYYEEWQPATQTERDLVNDMAASRWRLNRIIALETAALDHQMDAGRENFLKQHARSDEATRCASAWRDLVDNGQTLSSLARHESRLRRTIEKATKQLTELQRVRKENNTPSVAEQPARSEDYRPAEPQSPANSKNSQKSQNEPEPADHRASPRVISSFPLVVTCDLPAAQQGHLPKDS